MDFLHYDLCVIGGGINGAGIARDAAGRGLSVILVEAQDLAGATSSASTKLIHGGLRYLEQYEFSMVHKSLKEREILLKNAQHLIKPIDCVLPIDTTRSRSWIKMGLWLYDHLGGKKSLPSSRFFECASDSYGNPLQDHFGEAVVYSDCWVDDTRLVIANAVDAACRDARIATHTLCTSLEQQGGRWIVGLCDNDGIDELKISASMVVNATGPWVSKFLQATGLDDQDQDLPKTRLVKGSHLIFDKIYEGEQTYVLQQEDGRIVFVAPYEGRYTLVGTTEESYDGDPREARLSGDELQYLCASVNNAFKVQVKPQDAVFSFSGVRPLLDDGCANTREVTRDYRIYHHKRYDAPLLSVFGGKITTYRLLSEQVVNDLMRISGRSSKGAWTASVPLSGSDFHGLSIYKFLKKKRKEYTWLPESLLNRYVQAYGTRMDYFLYGAQCLEDLGEHFGENLYEAEVSYLCTYEWALSSEDVLWRRSKLGLHLSEQTIQRLNNYFHS